MTHTLRAALLLALVAAPVRAQLSASPLEEGAPAGIALALSGPTAGPRGSSLRFGGVAYETEGLTRLRPRADLVLEARLMTRTQQGLRPVEGVPAAQTRSRGDGRFTFAVALPLEPPSGLSVEIFAHRPNAPGRRFSVGVTALDPRRVDLLTDRLRYEPGETVHAWLRVLGEAAREPVAGAPVRVQLLGQDGRALVTRDDLATRASGTVVVDLPLPDGAPIGSYRVRAEVGGERFRREVTQGIQVFRRTVERLLATVEIDDADADGTALLRPGEPFTARVRVTTPSGNAVAGAQVRLARPFEGEAVTGPDGVATLELRAPAVFGEAVTRGTVAARVSHPAYGETGAAAPVILARTPALVHLTPEGGALVPEVPSRLYVRVTDPRGRPLRAGTEVVLSGPGLAGGDATLVVDGRGYAVAEVTLPRRAAARSRRGDCSGVAATYGVDVRGAVSRSCVPVTLDARVRLRRLGPPLVAPGATVEVEVARRADARRRPVLVEALGEGDAVLAYRWLRPSDGRGAITLPAGRIGFVRLRARPVDPENPTTALDAEGAGLFGAGSQAGVLVRPSDTFGLRVAPTQTVWQVGETATVRIEASRAPTAPAWTTLLVRDETAHAGEVPHALRYLADELHRALADPTDSERLLEAALAEGSRPDPRPRRAAPLRLPPWAVSRPGTPLSMVLADPVMEAEAARRGMVGGIEGQLERRLAGTSPNQGSWGDLVETEGSRRRFRPDVFERLRLRYRTLGGADLTLADVQRVDPAFTFDAVARRVTRQRLVRLLGALTNLTDPSSEAAQRASADLPPSRWLATLVQLRMVNADALLDGWGRPFVFLRVTGRRPRFPVAARALDWELASPGPDGRPGTGDDVKDPLARAVPAGSIYALTSGEDELLRRLSLVSPGEDVLRRLQRAYAEISLAAREEGRLSDVVASRSEGGAMADLDFAEEDGAFGGLGVAGTGRGGGGSGEGTVGLGTLGRGAGAGRRARAPRIGMGPPPAEPSAAMEPEPLDEATGGGRVLIGGASAPVAAILREDFPATLFFAGEIPLDGGAATVEVPLADALSTYHVESIAWTRSGWTTAGATRLRVDQVAVVDMPAPPAATVGDTLRLPIRIENRGAEPFTVTPQVGAEGVLAEASALEAVTLEPRSAREVVVSVRLPEAGQGTLTVAIVDASGRPLDGTRRPLDVRPDVRPVRVQREVLLSGPDGLDLEVPAEATARAEGQVRLLTGRDLFPELVPPSGSPARAWLDVFGARTPEAAAVERIVEALQNRLQYGQAGPQQLSELGLALAVLWERPQELTDEDAERAIALGSDVLQEDYGPAGATELARMLLLLSPIEPAHRPDVAGALRSLRGAAAREVARVSTGEAAPNLALSAAGLAAGGDRTRATELLRRIARGRVDVGDYAWIEPALVDDVGTGGSRASVTPLTALALILLDRRVEALPLLRGARVIAREDRSRERTFSWAAAAAEALAPGRRAPGDVVPTYDGRPLAAVEDETALFTLPELTAGAHRVAAAIPEGSLALLVVEGSYGLPWDMASARPSRLALDLDGAVGARDTRAGLRLRVRNRGTTVLTRGVVEVELPAGAELDEVARDALQARLAGPPAQEGRTLRLRLRPLGPAGRVDLPLRVRWTVGGALTGLGAIAYAEGDGDRVSTLASRTVEIADRGDEPEAPELEDDPPPDGPIPLEPPPVLRVGGPR
jgi:hypothetical protein